MSNSGLTKTSGEAKTRPGLPACGHCGVSFYPTEPVIIIDDGEDAFAYHKGCYGYSGWGEKLKAAKIKELGL